MPKVISSILSDWTNELSAILMDSNSLCIAKFSTSKKLLFANNSMAKLFTAKPAQSLINPTFDELLLLDNTVPLIFEGFLTLGDYSSINPSIWVQVYRKENELLIVGGVNAAQLLDQNKTMHQLNSEISNLQRELIREKITLQNTLKQLSQTNATLQELNISKDRFISILAHDLKSPFNGILGFLSLLTEDIHKFSIDEVEKIIHLINTSANSTYNLLEEILTWARAQAGKTPFNLENHNLSTICETIFNNLNIIATTKNITIDYTTLNGTIIYADKDMIHAVLRNLVSNAIKFTNHGGTINIYAKQHYSNIEITVSDTGVGIPANTTPKLFDISHKISTKGTANEKGTGLGLLLCKEFVEKHNGKIWVESELGKGSDFKFTIPTVN
ncbi:sensor histidine kinase [Lutibacter holmesii]|uniref:histidine kinase n=1 Tax=Lutibacter holmesii TaxID=1137985 RepID=A0ABW3WN15_9FLAO